MAGASDAEIRVVTPDQLRMGVASGEMTRNAAISGETVRSRGIFMGTGTVPPGFRSSAHVHTNCESALYVVSGRGRFLVGPQVDQELTIESGDFIYVPEGAPHVVVNDSDVDILLIVARNTQEEQVQEYEPE